MTAEEKIEIQEIVGEFKGYGAFSQQLLVTKVGQALYRLLCLLK